MLALATTSRARTSTKLIAGCSVALAVFGSIGSVNSLDLNSDPAVGTTEGDAAEPWLRPFTGPTRTDIDATTLDGKVLCG